MRELDRREGQPGADLQLTVDADLQNYVQARLGGESAAAVVMDCETGDLLRHRLGAHLRSQPVRARHLGGRLPGR